MRARLRSVPPVAAVTADRRAAGARRRRAVCDARRPARMRGHDPRQPDALRQYGRAAEAFPRFHRCGMGVRRAGRQSRPPRSLRPATMHGGQESTLLTMMLPLAASRRVDRRPAVYRSRTQRDDAAAARLMARAMSPAERRPRISEDDAQSRARARHARRNGRSETRVMKLVRPAICACGQLAALALVAAANRLAWLAGAAGSLLLWPGLALAVVPLLPGLWIAGRRCAAAC